MRIKFLVDESVYPISCCRYLTDDLLQIEGLQEGKEGGMVAIDDSDSEPIVLADFSRFVHVYESFDSTVRFVDDSNLWNVYDLYNAEGYFTDCCSVLADKSAPQNGVLRKSGYDKSCQFPEGLDYVDSQGIYNYKVSHSQMVEVEPDEKVEIKRRQEEINLAIAVHEKIEELASCCNHAIVAGVEINEERFSYTTEDQANIANLCQVALKTNLELPYHADGRSCKLYSAHEVVNLYVAEESNVTYHTTYFNQLKMYVQSLNEVDEVYAVKYGQELTGKYLSTFETIMDSAKAAIDAFTRALAADEARAAELNLEAREEAMLSNK